MELSQNGLEFEILQDAKIPFLGRDMSHFNTDHPHKHYETYHFNLPQGEAGFVALQMVEPAKMLWVHEIDVNPKIVGCRKHYGSLFLHYALKRQENISQIEEFLVKPNGVTDEGRAFFKYYDALWGINYQELMNKLETKI